MLPLQFFVDSCLLPLLKSQLRSTGFSGLADRRDFFKYIVEVRSLLAWVSYFPSPSPPPLFSSLAYNVYLFAVRSSSSLICSPLVLCTSRYSFPKFTGTERTGLGCQHYIVVITLSTIP